MPNRSTELLLLLTIAQLAVHTLADQHLQPLQELTAKVKNNPTEQNLAQLLQKLHSLNESDAAASEVKDALTVVMQTAGSESSVTINTIIWQQGTSTNLNCGPFEDGSIFLWFLIKRGTTDGVSLLPVADKQLKPSIISKQLDSKSVQYSEIFIQRVTCELSAFDYVCWALPPGGDTQLKVSKLNILLCKGGFY